MDTQNNSTHFFIFQRWNVAAPMAGEFKMVMLSLSQNFCASQLLAVLGFLLFVAKESMLCLLVLSFFFIGYSENAKHPPDKNWVSCSSHKIVWKHAYLSVKMMSLDQKQKIVIEVANLSVLDSHILFKDIKLSGKLPISVKENWVSFK